MSNQFQSVFYTGITNNLSRRIYEHKEKLLDGFTKSYNINKLLYFESTQDATSAIAREKQIKSYSRKKKIKLIESLNPNFKDLYDEIIQ
jgi:putative endonuclease